MYEVPSRGDIAKVIVDEESVTGGGTPTLIEREAVKPKKKSA